MEPALRRRLDLIIGLLSFVAIASLMMLWTVGGLGMVGYVLVFGLVATLLLRESDALSPEP